jgi:hypothetical protein
MYFARLSKYASFELRKALHSPVFQLRFGEGEHLPSPRLLSKRNKQQARLLDGEDVTGILSILQNSGYAVRMPQPRVHVGGFAHLLLLILDVTDLRLRENNIVTERATGFNYLAIDPQTLSPGDLRHIVTLMLFW